MHPRFYSIFILTALLLCSTAFARNRITAEWEPMQGVLIRHPFGIPTALIRSLAEIDTVYILVSGASAQAQANATLSAAQVNLANCRYVTAPTNSHWTRDWGPHSIFLNDQIPAIADPHFDGYPWVPGLRQNRPYELDNAVNSILANHLGVSLLSFPGYLTGGNFMTDGYGAAFSTQQMLAENLPLMTADQFLLHANQLLGIGNYYFTINPEFYGIQHIDCWAKLLNEETVLVKELPSWHPEYLRAEAIASFFAQTPSCFDRPYRVVRIYCDVYSGNSAAAYTNSLILNRRVFVPLFGIPADQAALQTYSDAMPGYEVLGFTGSWYHYDALHCRTMGIADFQMLRLEHRPPDQITTIVSGTLSFQVRIRSYGGHNLLEDRLKLFFRSPDDQNWQETPLTRVDQSDLYTATLGNLSPNTNLSYYLEAADSSGREARLPITAPAQYYSTTLAGCLSSFQDAPAALSLRLYPQPASSYLDISAGGKALPLTRISLYDLRGRLILDTVPANLSSTYRLDLSSLTLSSGIHFLRLHSPGSISTHRLVIIR